jgi:F0F1-type ATP synthase assembly protein I
MAEVPPEDQREVGYYFTLAQVGLEMVAPLFIGLALDHYLGSSPWGLIVGTVLGFVGGLAHLVMLANRQDRNGGSGEGGAT